MKIAINLDTKVDIVTNGTKLPDSTLDILQKFKNMNIYLSVDGIGPHNNYIRSGSKWEEVGIKSACLCEDARRDTRRRLGSCRRLVPPIKRGFELRVLSNPRHIIE